MFIIRNFSQTKILKVLILFLQLVKYSLVASDHFFQSQSTYGILYCSGLKDRKLHHLLNFTLFHD